MEESSIRYKREYIYYTGLGIEEGKPQPFF